MTFSLTTTLTILVILLLLIDVILRVKTLVPKPDPSIPRQDSALKEFFQDHKGQLSFTRLSIAVALVFGFGVIIYGLYHPQLLEQCNAMFGKTVDLCKAIFIVGKTPESIDKLQGAFRRPEK